MRITVYGPEKQETNFNGKGVVRESEGSGKAAMIPKVEMLTR